MNLRKDHYRFAAAWGSGRARRKQSPDAEGQGAGRCGGSDRGDPFPPSAAVPGPEAGGLRASRLRAGARGSAEKHIYSLGLPPSRTKGLCSSGALGAGPLGTITSVRRGGLALAVRRAPPGTQLRSLLRREVGGFNVSCPLRPSAAGAGGAPGESV